LLSHRGLAAAGAVAVVGVDMVAEVASVEAAISVAAVSAVVTSAEAVFEAAVLVAATSAVAVLAVLRWAVFAQRLASTIAVPILPDAALVG
jgi:hypothetical protein